MTTPRPAAFAALLACAATLAAVARAEPGQDAPATAPAAAPIPPPEPDLTRMRLDRALGRYVAPYGGGQAILTIEPRLQARLERSLATWTVPWGATVLLDPASGRVLAMAEHAQADRSLLGGVLRAVAPAASIFKIVTAAALLEHGVDPQESVCYHGGKHRLAPRLLKDDPRRDRRCLTLERAFGFSANVVFAKLAARALTPEALRAQADRLLFDASLPFEGAIEPSRAEIPEDLFGLANTAAGFGAVRLSPLHAAALAAAVANGGVLAPPRIVEAVEGAPAPVPPAPLRVVDEEVAARLDEMMRSTVQEGTARRFFRRPPPALRGVEVAGKTGSLFERAPFRDWSWFVGYAPADAPQVAIATVVMNGSKWRVRAPWVAREALTAWFEDQLAAATPARLPAGALAGR